MARRAVVAVAEEDASDELIDFIGGLALDPLGFVLGVFPWGEEGTDLADEAGPDDWQRELLEELGRQVRERVANPDLPAIQIAVASGHGVGKSTFLCWVVLWMMSCHIDPTITVTANTLGQLTGKTWRELAKWHRRMLNADWFQWTATQFYAKEAPGTHKADAVPWSKERSEAFQGAHAKYLLTVFDEGSAIDDSIWVATDGAMTTRGAIWLVFGNPTRNTGRFRECFGKYRHLWQTRKIDSRTVEGTNRAYLDELAATYGEDSDVVKVRVRGEFPSQSVSQFIASDAVQQAQERQLQVKDQGAACILGVDIARFGDDQSIIRGRMGRDGRVIPPIKWRGMDTVFSAHKVAEAMRKYNPDAVFIDGGGVGGGVVDILKSQGYKVIEVNFGSAARESLKYANKRAEMWANMREWLTTGVVDPDVELADDLVGVEYGFDKDGRLLLEKKEDMKKRGLASPDNGDALALTFAEPVQRKDLRTSRFGMGRNVQSVTDYSPI